MAMRAPPSTGLTPTPGGLSQSAEPESHAPDHLTALVTRLAAADWFAFDKIRPAAVLRRVQERMRACSVASLSEYLSLLQRSADEVVSLRTALLASGTTFFRPPEAWDFIERVIIPRLLDRASPSRPLRVWLPQCGRGAEAYTMAMLLLEQSRAAQRGTDVQLFASDPDERALQIGRAGVFPRSAGEAIGRGRLDCFFLKLRHGYRVTPQLRKMVLFARHDLFCDLPFRHMDLVCCRGFLACLQPPAREEIATLLHRSLNDGGYLILGPGEQVGRAAGSLQVVSRRWGVFRRRDGGADLAGVEGARPGTIEPSRLTAVVSEALATSNGDHAQVARMLRLMTMGKLAASLAHELSQPLSALANILEACATHLRNGAATSEELLDLTNDASSQSHRAGRIVAHITRLLHDGERRVERCELRTLVRTAAELVRPTHLAQGIELELVLGEVPLWGDLCRVEIEQVIVNLLQNSIDAIIEGGGNRRQIRVEASTTSTGHATVTVADTGSGIPAEVATRLFEPFFTTKADGLGMGLAICRSMVDAHGGGLWTDRKPDGDGTRMGFSLPLARGEAAAPNAP